MTEYTDLFNTLASTEEFRKLERDDYNHAIAGVEVGRMLKHIPNASIDPITGQKETAAARLARTLQWLLLNDENYARAHKAAVTAVNNAMDAATQALLDVEAALKQATADIEDIFDRSATLPDGRKVFRDENGEVVDQDGNFIATELADGIIWQGDEPTYEEYLAQRARIEKLQEARNELLGIEAELGGHQNDLNNNENPPSPDELGEIEDGADELRERIEEIQEGLERQADNSLHSENRMTAEGLSHDSVGLSQNLKIDIGSFS